MVQNVSAGQGANNYGSINRVGVTDNGRVVYQVVDGEGRVAGKMSLPQNQCDVFEKSFNDIIECTPKLQQYMATTTPEKMEKKQKASKWIILGTTALGACVPMFKKGKGFWKPFAWGIAGALAGLAAGVGIAISTTTPPGAMKLSKATKNISKLDIQPVQEGQVQMNPQNPIKA